MTDLKSSSYEQVRHKSPTEMLVARPLVVACAPLRSQVNLSSIVRTAGCCGVSRIIACGSGKIDRKLARDGADTVEIEVHRSLAPVIKKLRSQDYRVVALEQTTHSVNLHTYAFPRKTALIIGNERLGLSSDELALADDCVEIPVWGLPHSYNVATATAMALYEYCRQFPQG